MKTTKLKEIRLPEVYVLNFLGQELPEPFGAITSVIKTRIFLPGKYFTGDGAFA
jgi:hypothetical protein